MEETEETEETDGIVRKDGNGLNSKEGRERPVPEAMLVWRGV